MRGRGCRIDETSVVCSSPAVGVPTATPGPEQTPVWWEIDRSHDILTALGSTLVHPRHGALTVTAHLNRTVGGVETPMIALHSELHQLSLQVPVAQLEEVGLREVVAGEELAKLRAVLAEDFVEEPSNWSRRFKSYEQKVATGSILLFAEVVRDLSRRNWEKGVSPGEKRLLEKVRKQLIDELALVPGITGLEEAEAYLDAAIRGEAA